MRSVMRSATRAILVCVSSGSLIGASLLGLGLARAQADAEDDYLLLVKRVAVTNLPDDTTLRNLGHSACKVLSNNTGGHSFDGVQGVADGVMEYLDGTTRDRGHDSGVVVFAAAKFLCPENLALVSAWKDS